MEEESSDLPANQEKKRRKRRKKKKGVEEGGSETASAVKSSTEEPSDTSTGEAPEERTDASSSTGVPSGTKNLEDVQLNGAGGHSPQTPGRKRNKRNLKSEAAKADVSSVAGGTLKDAPTPATNVQEGPPQVEEEENLSVTAEKKRKKKKKQLSATADAGGSSAAPPPEQREGASQVKRKKIPVVFEFEADELQTFSNGEEDETANAVSPKSHRIRRRTG